MQDYYLEIAKVGLYVYVALLAIAAVFDMWKFIIPNVLSVALIGLFILVGISSPFKVEWGSHFGAAGVFLVAGIGFYAFKILGAGDVKLITAVAVWWGFGHLLELLFCIGLAGGLLAIILIGLRRLIPSLLVAMNASEKTSLPRLLLPGEAVPYGVGIAAGSIFLVFRVPLPGAL